ncbi:MAG: SRPBCC family protein [Dinghuibacter sp.]|nr:SRPBCC family protein [Dinghuibacter sp.]
MRTFRVILISLLALFGVVMIFAMLIPADTRVSRAVSIKAQRDSVKNVLLNLQQWPLWHPNLKRANDSNPIVYAGNALKFNGFTMQVEPTTDSTVRVNMTNREGEQLHSTIQLVNLNADTCVVNWYADFHSKWYPWEKFRSMFFDQLYGPSLDSNLVRLKQFTEK